MKAQKLAILFIIIISLIPVYAASKYLQKIIQPRTSFGRLLLYMCAVLAVVFLATFGIVLLIRNMFHPAS